MRRRMKEFRFQRRSLLEDSAAHDSHTQIPSAIRKPEKKKKKKLLNRDVVIADYGRHLRGIQAISVPSSSFIEPYRRRGDRHHVGLSNQRSQWDRVEVMWANQCIHQSHAARHLPFGTAPPLGRRSQSFARVRAREWATSDMHAMRTRMQQQLTCVFN